MKPAISRRFEVLVQILIAVSLLTFSVETLPDLSQNVRTALDITEKCILVVFAIEYFFRIITAEKPLKFVFSFFGLIDFLAILPLFLIGFLDLRFARVVRLIRLFRILKLARYNAATRRFHVAILLAKEEIILFLALTGIILFLASVGIYHFEHEAQPEQFKSVFHSLWWAITTLTTVGYGDVVPVTLGGRCFTFAVLLVGLGIVSIPAGLVSAALVKARTLELDQLSVKEPEMPDSDE
ncbi:MAG: ion transporter [Planctomyces sp.]